jgi:hypothetical protein
MKIIDHPTIISAGELKMSNGCQPNRLVLRLEGGSYQPYIIHHETMKVVGDSFVHEFFYDGSYFSTLEAAEKAFRERT